MKLYLLLSVCFIGAFAVRSCGHSPVAPNITTPPLAQLIVGGTDAIPYSWPWQVDICRILRFGSCASACGGTIIGTYYVLTSASCFYGDYNPRSYRVRAADYSDFLDSEPGEETGHPLRIFIHPNFTELHFHDDIAVIELMDPFNITDHLQPVCLSSVETTATVGIATGYGSSTYGEFPKHLSILRQTHLAIVDPSQCHEPAYHEFDDKTMICAGDSNNGLGVDDGGCPLVVKARDGRWFQYGVGSQHGFQTGKPSTFVKVSPYCDFITRSTRNIVKCSNPNA